MKCPNCGAQVSDTAAFCRECGTPLTAGPAQSPVGSPGTPQTGAKKKRRWIVPVILAGCAAAAVILFCSVYFSGSARFSRALESGDISLAEDIYVKDRLWKNGITDEQEERLEAEALSVAERYAAKDISQAEAEEQLELLSSFEEPGVEDAIGVSTRIISAFSSGNSGNYFDAAEAFDQILEENPDNAAATSGLAIVEKAYRDSVSEEADKLIEEGNYSNAAQTVENAMRGHFESDPQLTEILNGLDDRQVEAIAEQAEQLTLGGDWDGALELIDEYAEENGMSDSLQGVRDEISSTMPITLKNLQKIDSDDVEIIDSLVRDRWGNTYDGAVFFGPEASAYYNLAGQFTTFTGTLFMPESSNSVPSTIAIYVNENLVWYQQDLTTESAVMPFSIDVSGAQTMRITTEGGWLSGDLAIGDTSFTRVAATGEEAAPEAQTQSADPQQGAE